MTTTLEYHHIGEHTQKIVDQPLSQKEVTELYSSWADDYEEDIQTMQYTGYQHAAKYFSQFAEKYGFGKNMKILDFGSGTGVTGKELATKHGFTNIDAVDGCQEMLDKAEKLGVYGNLVQSWIGGGNKMPFADDCYDAAIGSGVFVPSHIPLDGLYDIARCVKPGGLIVNSMRREWTLPGTSYGGFHDFVKKLENEEVWEHVADIIPEEKYYLHYDGLVSIFRVK